MLKEANSVLVPEKSTTSGRSGEPSNDSSSPVCNTRPQTSEGMDHGHGESNVSVLGQRHSSFIRESSTGYEFSVISSPTRTLIGKEQMRKVKVDYMRDDDTYLF